MRYIIYCDESDDKGAFYSNFYGGALVRVSEREAIEAELAGAKGAMHASEFKWTKIGPHNEAQYVEFIRRFFQIIAEGRIKFRVMFTQNVNQTQISHPLDLRTSEGDVAAALQT